MTETVKKLNQSALVMCRLKNQREQQIQKDNMEVGRLEDLLHTLHL